MDPDHIGTTRRRRDRVRSIARRLETVMWVAAIALLGTAAWMKADATWYQHRSRDVLGAALPAGRYWFAAIVRVPGRDVYLAAGDAPLSR